MSVAVREHKDKSCSVVWSDGKRYHVLAGPMPAAHALFAARVANTAIECEQYGIKEVRKLERINPHRKPKSLEELLKENPLPYKGEK